MREGDKPLVWLHGEIKTPPPVATPREVLKACQRRLTAYDQIG